ncbi:type II toxin-antitoxin system VapC family toxin [Larkinella terrae]|uniref:Ribonuclease VapC n=1 Tax=Larkinella terrae TaxID=2025311 RepID=A0A7K0ESV1_9BACT|nr:type II toxin-antitoxin system VapC family toxin [Larkinella terrae]MRS64842.1 PIN domain-containing protein [Larkinella terrae]
MVRFLLTIRLKLFRKTAKRSTNGGPSLDTSILIDYFRKTDKSKTRLVRLSQRFEQLCISSVTEFEIYSGANPQQLGFWNQLLDNSSVYPFDSQASKVAVDIQQDLKRLRKTIDKADLFIAATAVANNLILDTLNRKHFDQIAKLTLLDSRIE